MATARLMRLNPPAPMPIQMVLPISTMPRIPIQITTQTTMASITSMKPLPGPILVMPTTHRLTPMATVFRTASIRIATATASATPTKQAVAPILTIPTPMATVLMTVAKAPLTVTAMANSMRLNQRKPITTVMESQTNTTAMITTRTTTATVMVLGMPWKARPTVIRATLTTPHLTRMAMAPQTASTVTVMAMV